MSEYPHDVDAVWLAANAHGHVAAFVTAGEGPVPEVVVGAVDLVTGDIEQLLQGLPVKSDILMEVSYPDMRWLAGMAKRGFFVYDWSDAHRATKDRLNAYERAVVPQSPIMLHQCVGRIGEILRIAPVISGDFGRLLLPEAPLVWPSPWYR